MSTILVSTIVRNETRYLDRYHAQLKALVASQPQHVFLLSIFENDSTDGSDDKIRSLDWSFFPAKHLTTATLQTQPFIGGKHPLRVRLLADARNRSIFHCGFLGVVDWIFSLEPDVVLTPEVGDKIINHERHFGARYDVFTGKSTHVGTSHLYDSWGSRKLAAHDDFCQSDGVEDRGLEEMWSVYNCACLMNAQPFKEGKAAYSGVNPRTGVPDCDTVAVVESMRLAGFNRVAWHTDLHVPHSIDT